MSCYLTHTTAETHKLIRDNLAETPVYGGWVDARGPRCGRAWLCTCVSVCVCVCVRAWLCTCVCVGGGGGGGGGGFGGGGGWLF
jgi:hypothetical protein